MKNGLNIFEEGMKAGIQTVFEMFDEIIERDYDSYDKDNAVYLVDKVRRIFSDELSCN